MHINNIDNINHQCQEYQYQLKLFNINHIDININNINMNNIYIYTNIHTRKTDRLWGVAALRRLPYDYFGVEILELWYQSVNFERRKTTSRAIYEDRYKATWERVFKLSWREAGPPNHNDDKVDSDQ